MVLEQALCCNNITPEKQIIDSIIFIKSFLKTISRELKRL